MSGEDPSDKTVDGAVLEALRQASVDTVDIDATGADPGHGPSTPPKTTAGHVVLGVLGSGAMADVHLARDETLRRHVALKVLNPKARGNPEARRRFVIGPSRRRSSSTMPPGS